MAIHLQHKNAAKALLACIITLCIASCTKKGSNYAILDGFAQGGTYHLVYQMPANLEQASLPDTLSKCFSRIDKSLSGYDSTSLVSQINRGENPPLDSLFIECFNLSKDIYEENRNGYFKIYEK